MRLKLVFALTICALVLIGAGCASSKGAKSAGAAEPEGTQDVMPGIPLAPEFRIVDIPVPAEFEFERENSFVFQNNMIDVGRIQYSGKEKIGEVAQFYLDEMPRYNWTLLNVAEHRTIMLFFEKEDKSCQVLLTPKVRGTQLEISFSPKATERAPEY